MNCVSIAAFVAASIIFSGCGHAATLPAPEGAVRVAHDGTVTFRTEGAASTYAPRFTVLCAARDPEPQMRPAGIAGVLYNAATWRSERGDVRRVARTDDQVGDGFDAGILEGDVAARTFSIFEAGERVEMRPCEVVAEGDRVRFVYPRDERFSLEAELSIDSASGYPMLACTLRPAVDGCYSVGFTGYEAVDTARVEELWQPMIWQERRFPDRSYATLAFRCPVPSAFVTTGGVSRGVVAHPAEFPFDPLPTAENSRFCVALRTAEGEAAPMLFAPVPGGAESAMRAGDSYRFAALLFACRGNTTDALQRTAERIYGFRDRRRNDIATLNEAIDRIVDYAMSPWSRFDDERKGCAYSTDVPGAVKNVSALHPFEIALIADHEAMYERRALPVLEYMLSREKFLFTADSAQRIQYPSRRLDGPCAPVSELTTLYDLFRGGDPFLVRMAEREWGRSRIRNLDVREEGRTWKNALHLFRATRDSAYLSEAVRGADAYIAARIARPATDFSDPMAGGFFFWTGFAPKWIDLLELYETTGERRFLEAAHRGARLYAQYVWFAPQVPDTTVVVHPDGWAPHYAYLKQKGHPRMAAPREEVPARRLSEIGLTPESSGTCTGHRAIFMANYAAWFVRLAHYTGDGFLAAIAEHAVVGRYRNFPGYHINTARTTAYERADYPLRDHRALSVNSFHYNHIMPHVSLLYDYLLSDALRRSDGAIRFPDAFIEAYAYLQSKFYGHRPGSFYGERAWLWMPAGLAASSDVELNYVAARGDDALYLAFSNQCDRETVSTVRLDTARLGIGAGDVREVRLLSPEGACGDLRGGAFEVTVAPRSLTAVKIAGVRPQVGVQRRLLNDIEPWRRDYAASGDDRVRCMVLRTGGDDCWAFVYFTVSDTEFDRVTVEVGGERHVSTTYPYEFAFPVDADRLEIRASARRRDGCIVAWEPLLLEK